MILALQLTDLAEVCAFLGDSEVSLLVGASEQARVVEVVRVRVVGLAPAERHPEEVVWLAALCQHLQTNINNNEVLVPFLIDQLS